MALNGAETELTCDFFPTLELGDGQYEIGLKGLYTSHNIPNITARNNKLHFRLEGEMREFALPEGIYEFNDIMDSLNHLAAFGISQSDLKQLRGGDDVKVPGGNQNSIFTLSLNKYTLGSVISTLVPIDFTRDNSIGSMLGFKKCVLEANKSHVSHLPINISPLNVICVQCNIAGGSYLNGRPTHTVHQFYPSVGAGYKIAETPAHIVYLPVIVRSVNTLSIRLEDQQGQRIDLRGEELTVVLHMRRVR